MAVDFKSLSRNDQGALIAGGVAIVLSFFGSYVTASFDGGEEVAGLSISTGTNAWTSYATLGMLLVVASVAVVAVKAFAKDSLPAGVPWNLVAAATAGLGTVLLILRALFAGDDGGLTGLSVGPGWSGYLLWIAGIALTAFTVLSFRESGEEIPELKKNDTPPPPPAA